MDKVYEAAPPRSWATGTSLRRRVRAALKNVPSHFNKRGVVLSTRLDRPDGETFSPFMLAVEFGCVDRVKEWIKQLWAEDFTTVSNLSRDGFRQLLTAAHVVMAPEVVAWNRCPSDAVERTRYVNCLKETMDVLGLHGVTFNEVFPQAASVHTYTQSPLSQGRSEGTLDPTNANDQTHDMNILISLFARALLWGACPQGGGGMSDSPWSILIRDQREEIMVGGNHGSFKGRGRIIVMELVTAQLRTIFCFSE